MSLRRSLIHWRRAVWRRAVWQRRGPAEGGSGAGRSRRGRFGRGVPVFRHPGVFSKAPPVFLLQARTQIFARISRRQDTHASDSTSTHHSQICSKTRVFVRTGTLCHHKNGSRWACRSRRVLADAAFGGRDGVAQHWATTWCGSWCVCLLSMPFVQWV